MNKAKPLQFGLQSILAHKVKLAFAFWLGVYLFTVLLDLAASIVRGNQGNTWLTLIVCLIWPVWIPLTFLSFWLSRAFPLQRRKLAGSILLHGFFSVLVSLIHTLVAAAVMIGAMKWLVPERNAFTFVTAYLLLMLHNQFFIYFLIVVLYNGYVYLKKYQAERLHNVQLQSQLVQAENAALKMQIQPHFLFNTHNSIISLIVQNRNEEAATMLESLSDLLRRTIELPENDMVPLADELLLVKHYVDIQKIRFGDRLTLVEDIEPGTLSVLVPPLSIQPLIENAIRHGVEPVAYPCLVRLTAVRDGQQLVIGIADTGAGLRTDRIAPGTGIRNIKKRLDNLYGNKASLSIVANGKAGVHATITLPGEFTNGTEAESTDRG
ncbi:MAG TPA: histidine kinase [Flavisolibacter sp.]|nr:histidine kinase [Flavisolibacter sp.]